MTSYSKIKGRSKGYRYRNSIVDLQRDLWRKNAKKTPKELGMDERFEDDPRAIREKDYGRVNRVSTSTIQHMRGGSQFEEQKLILTFRNYKGAVGETAPFLRKK